MNSPTETIPAPAEVAPTARVAPSDDFAFVGKRITKPDAWDKVLGKAQYGHDLRLPRMLHGAIRRSDRAHARITRIDTTKAKALPGVKAVITAADYDAPFMMGFLKDQPVLKGDIVRSYRDEIAAVAAVDEDTARRACALIEVEYEDFPPVFSVAEAIAPDAPQLHAGERFAGNRVPVPWHFTHGDVERGLAESDVVVEETYDLPYQAHACLEPCICLAEVDGRGDITVHASTQIPFLLQRDLGQSLRLGPERLRIVQPTIGGAFGSKLDSYPYEYVTVLLALAAHRPVRLAFTRGEEFKFSTNRQPARITCAHGAMADGTLVARRIHVELDNGAYTSWGATTPHVMMLAASSLYVVPHIDFKADIFYTNNPHSGAFRGYGNPQVTFAIESNLDTLAGRLGLDPLTLRQKNCNRPNTITPQGLEVTTCTLDRCLDAVQQRLDFSRRHGTQRQTRRGIGLASMFHVGGGGRIYRSDGLGVIVKMDDFGRVVVMAGATEIGQGSDASLTQIAAEELGVHVDDVHLINNDTDVTLWDVGVHASRTTFIGGNAIRAAATKLKATMAPVAATLLGRERHDDLVFRNRTIFAPDAPERSVPIAKVARAIHFKQGGDVLAAHGFYDPPTELPDDSHRGNMSATYAFGTQAAEVEVDLETGQVRVLRLVAAHDVGRAINPMNVEGQIEGGAAMGLGYALMEELQVHDGKITNANFMDYRLPTALDMPRVEVVLIEEPDPAGPYGAKGVGEAGMICAAAAIANAIADATGVRVRQLPITPERLRAAIRVAADSCDDTGAVPLEAATHE